MIKIENTIFISYRRANAAWALAIYQYLTQNAYDVFFDFEGIGSGDFERIIIENIRARAHFIILLTPSSLGRCTDPTDLLRREIETALRVFIKCSCSRNRRNSYKTIRQIINVGPNPPILGVPIFYS